MVKALSSEASMILGRAGGIAIAHFAEAVSGTKHGLDRTML